MKRAQSSSSAPAVLTDCPGTPNCVSSQASDRARLVSPISCQGSCRETLDRLRRIVESTAGASIVVSTDTYLRAEYTSRLLRFVDDLELLVDENQEVIHIRSASRVGTWDCGVNRRRVEGLRSRLDRLRQ